MDDAISARMFEASDSNALLRGFNVVLTLSNDGRVVLLVFFALLYHSYAEIVHSAGLLGALNHVIATKSRVFELLVLVLLDSALCALLKTIIRRPRPPYGMEKLNGEIFLLSDIYSCPSGHASRAFLLGYFACEHIANGPPLLRLVPGWSFLVALSRIALGRHYLSDVVLGSIIGLVNYHLFYHQGVRSHLFSLLKLYIS